MNTNEATKCSGCGYKNFVSTWRFITVDHCDHCNTQPAQGFAVARAGRLDWVNNTNLPEGVSK